MRSYRDRRPRFKCRCSGGLTRQPVDFRNKLLKFIEKAHLWYWMVLVMTYEAFMSVLI